MLHIRLRSRRKELNLSQEEMADKLGITRQGYGHYETGRNEPDSKTLVKLSEILNCTTDYLYGKTDNPIQKDNELKINEEFDFIYEINTLLRKYGIDQSGFFDIEKWKTAGPEGIKQLENYFQFIVEQAEKQKKEEQQDD